MPIRRGRRLTLHWNLSRSDGAQVWFDQDGSGGFTRLPSLFAGAAMCMFGFIGAFSRYVAAEQSPVAKDTFN